MWSKMENNELHLFAVISLYHGGKNKDFTYTLYIHNYQTRHLTPHHYLFYFSIIFFSKKYAKMKKQCVKISSLQHHL